MKRGVDRVYKIELELIRREMQNIGRWCEINIKKTGEVLKVVRTGYGPMEYPERDSHVLKNSDGIVIAEGSTLREIAKYIDENY